MYIELIKGSLIVLIILVILQDQLKIYEIISIAIISMILISTFSSPQFVPFIKRLMGNKKIPANDKPILPILLSKRKQANIKIKKKVKFNNYVQAINSSGTIYKELLK